MTRSLIDMNALDDRLEEQVSRYGDLKDFHFALWRQEPDITGSNWDARVEHFRGDSANDSSWWGVVPQLRERFNLS